MAQEEARRGAWCQVDTPRGTADGRSATLSNAETNMSIQNTFRLTNFAVEKYCDHDCVAVVVFSLFTPKD